MSGTFYFVSPAWNNDTAWAPNGIPGAGDTVYIGSGVVPDDGTAKFVIAGQAGLATFNGTITTENFVAFSVEASGATLSAADEFFVVEGYTLYATNSATLAGAVVANPTDSGVGTADFVDVGVISLSNSSTLTAYKLFDFGTLDVTTGSVVTLHNLYVTGADANSGPAPVPGVSTGSLTAENGTLIMTDGSISDALAVVGAGIAESSTVTVSGGTWSNTQLMVASTTGALLDISGTGTVSASGGGSMLLGTQSQFVVDFGLYEGAQATAGGTLQVTDSTDLLSIGSDWVIGDAGSHADLIEGGATVSVGGAMTLARGGGTGTLTLTGPGTVVTVSTGDITVGLNGSATLNVDAGAALTTGAAASSVLSGTAEIGQTSEISAATAAIGSTGTLTLAGGTLAASNSVDVHGTVSGLGTIAGALLDDGSVNASGGTLLVLGSVSGTGEIGVANGTLELQSTILAGPTIGFAGGEVMLDVPGAPGVTFSGFAPGDTLVLQGLIANAGTFSGGMVTLDDGGAPLEALAFSGSYAPNAFSVTTTGNETTVTMAPCFVSGTRIALADGWRTVEDLRPGDVVRLAHGGTALVRWIGHPTVTCERHPRPADVWPVRIAPHAFAPGQPARPLWLSPDHAVFVDGVLIPVRYLLNGATVRQQRTSSASYWHVELDRHAVLLAEGLPAESYLDTGNRAAFANGGTVAQATPEFARSVWASRGCAELVVAGEKVLAARHRLLARARELGHELTNDPALHLRADGREIPPVSVLGGCYRFALPPRATLRLCSRGAAPAEIDATSSDTRRLGVMITRLAILRGDTVQEIALDALADADGWHGLERDGAAVWRWTDGAALLPADATAGEGPALLHVEVALAMPSWSDVGQGCSPPRIARSALT